MQIYTLRDLLEKDLEGTLEKVAGIGYNTIEAYGYEDGMILGRKPGELKNIAQGFGLNLLSCHFHVTRFSNEKKDMVTDRWKRTVGDFHESGVKYIANAHLGEEERKNIDDYKGWAETFNRFGELSNDAGIRFGYHNHSFEFDDHGGMTGFDVLTSETEPSLVFFESDLYWMVRAGRDPVDCFNKNKGRFKLWHVKDMEDSESKDFAEVGQGTIDFKRIFDAREVAGLEHFFVEQDRCKRDEFVSIKMSLDYLNKASFV